MTVKDFIPIEDFKITTEKEVKPKPSISELTTVEVPGKPTPASFLESPKEKIKLRKKTRKKAEASYVSNVKRDGILIITEKPQAAQKIAYALGNAKKYTDGGVSYFEVERNEKKIYVASAVGHLFGLNYKKGQKDWPIFEVEWQPSFNKKNAAFTRKYYELLKKLSNRATEYVIGMDYDIEGEVIGWNIVRFICKKDNAKRMKFSTLTAPELVKSYENLNPHLNWGNAYAGETRHILDWLYGINLSRALMSAIKKTGSFKILSIGRVQGPALKIIVEREKEIESFKPEPYWQVFATVQDLRLKHVEDIFNKDDLKKFENLKEGTAETTKSRENILPPHPFDLTSLQREAYNLYKINPSQTLAIAQKLYLEGLISYPRTSSQKIPDAINPKEILKKLEEYFPEARQATRQKPIEGKKSDPAHPSIYPTGEHSENLSPQEQKLYNLIVKRFIAAFSSDAIIDQKRIILISNDLKFTTSGITIVEKGWTSFYPTRMEETYLPDINGTVKIDKIDIEQKETQPPRRYTPASLVSILERKNLGTKTTRSIIVDILFDRGYLEGTSIKATPLGIKLIDSLQKYSSIIIDENLTRQIEEQIEKMQEDKSNLKEKEEEIIEKAKKIINDISKEFKSKEKEIGLELIKGIEIQREAQNQSNILMPCPTCKQGNLRIMYNKKARRYFVACSNYPNCTQTYTLPPNSLIKKSETQCEADKFPKLLAIRKGRRPWEFCFNPECPLKQSKNNYL